MELNYGKLAEIPLFRGIRSEELKKLLSCLRARRRSYAGQEIILMEGQAVSEIGIVLSGRVRIVREDYDGNRMIVAEIPEREMFAESFACARSESLLVTAVSMEKSEILWISSRRMISPCPDTCPYHVSLTENMLSILASKNILLSRKLDYLSKRSIREKLLTFLSDRAPEESGTLFRIPFNRQELADYLCVDRSALSTELGKLKREGILEYEKNCFRLYRANGSAR